eukprot:2239014-Karenia_brevis.AAC.1
MTKCANTSAPLALQLLMSPGVAPSSVCTVALARSAACRHQGRPLPFRTWVSEFLDRAADPDAQML